MNTECSVFLLCMFVVTCLTYSSTQNWRQCASPKCCWISPGLHDLISKETVNFKDLYIHAVKIEISGYYQYDKKEIVFTCVHYCAWQPNDIA